MELYQSTDIHFHVCHNILLPIRIHSLRDQQLYRERDKLIDRVTYLHRRKDMSTYKTCHIQTSYIEKEIDTCTRTHVYIDI